jgi:hypothetical protein
MRILLALSWLATCAWAQEGTGPFPAIFEQDPNLPTHTVYRPMDLSQLKGQKLPIIAWGNGACVNNGLSHRNFLLEIASYGYLAVAIGPPQPTPASGQGKEGPAPAAKGAEKQAAPAGPATKSSELIDAINWALDQNSQKGSRYQGKLDPSKIVVMGMSCGGIQSLAVATDPRIKLVGIWNSGILNMPLAAGAPAMEDVRKDQLEKLHSPIFYVNGDKTDIAYENGLDDYNRITKVPAIRLYRDGVGHGGTYSQPNGGEFAKVAVAMLKWQFHGDKVAAKMFVGDDCGFCKDPKWHVSSKGIK